MRFENTNDHELSRIVSSVGAAGTWLCYNVLIGVLASEWKAFAALAVNDLAMPAEAMPMYDNAAKWSRKAERIKAFVMSVGDLGHNRDMHDAGSISDRKHI